jgi:hypothetical protein
MGGCGFRTGNADDSDDTGGASVGGAESAVHIERPNGAMSHGDRTRLEAPEGRQLDAAEIGFEKPVQDSNVA